jgi:broad specificity phosphatase PhoE
VAKRAGGVFDEASRQGKTVLISAHNGPIQAILCHALGIGAAFRSRFLILNCSLSTLECPQDGVPRLILMNDTCHLDGLA